MARAVNRIAIIMSNFDITLLVANKLDKPTALQGRKIRSGTIHACHSFAAALKCSHATLKGRDLHKLRDPGYTNRLH